MEATAIKIPAFVQSSEEEQEGEFYLAIRAQNVGGVDGMKSQMENQLPLAEIVKSNPLFSTKESFMGSNRGEYVAIVEAENEKALIEKVAAMFPELDFSLQLSLLK